MNKKNIVEQMMKEFNGCPLFEGREKGSLDELTGLEVTIADFYNLADYHAVIFEESPEKVYLSGGGLKKLLTKYGEDAIGVKIVIEEMIKTAKKNDYRPIRVVG
jgi:hypothetical protein